MDMKKCTLLLLFLPIFVLTGCSQSPQEREGLLKVGMVLDTGGEKDHGYNEYSLLGARKAAETSGIAFDYVVSETKDEYRSNIEKVIQGGADLVFTVGFTLADATAWAARQHPERHFAIMDYAYHPGRGCPGDAASCYTETGGLDNVTSLVFTEDQPAYLAGVLAACMSRTGIIGTVGGEKIPPVTKLVKGFEKGARATNPEIVTYKRYIPDFNDPASGYQMAMEFISKGVDVLFCAAGKTGLGGLRAAKEAGVKAVGVDVDQYFTFPEARSVLITSVMKNVDVAAGVVVDKFVAGSLKAGIFSFDLKSDAVGLAPYHEWENRIPQECKDLVAQANRKIVMEPETVRGENP